MHREMLVAVQVRRFAPLEELGRDADAPFRRASNLFELTWQASERERGGESGSDKGSKSGSGKMKAALQCVEWRKKGRSCFHELRWSRHSQEVQCALCRGRARPQAARGSDRGQLGLRFRSIFCEPGRAEQSGGGSVLELGLSPRRARRDRASGRSGAGPSL